MCAESIWEYTKYASGHCAELLVSFASRALLPAVAAASLPPFVNKWVATKSSVMEIIEATMTPTYINQARPVFSSRHMGHFTLVNPSPTMVGGKIVTCGGRDCCGELDSTCRGDGGTTRWTLKCLSCNRKTSYKAPRDTMIDKEDEGQIMTFEDHAYFRTPFPIPIKIMDWVFISSTPSTPSSFDQLRVPYRHRTPSISASTSTSDSIQSSPSLAPSLLGVTGTSPDPPSQPAADVISDQLGPVDLGPMIPRKPRQQVYKRSRKSSGQGEGFLLGEESLNQVKRKKSGSSNFRFSSYL